MEKIRVAQIIGNVFEGGVESCIMNYFTNIDTSRISFDFFVERDSKVIDKAKIESLGGRVVIVPHYTHFFKYMSEMKRLLKEGNYDICHANMTTLNVFPLWCAKKAGIRVRIAHGHSTNSKQEKLRSFFKTVLKPFSTCFATELFACGEKAGNWLYGSKHDFKIINNAVDLSRFKFNPEKREEIRSLLDVSDKFVIGHVGRFCPQKNQEFLINVFFRVKSENSNAILLLVGEGPDFVKIKDYVKSKGLEKDVVFVGSCNNPQDYYQAMDCFVLPSLYEGLPVVAQEAQTNGLRCLFSDQITREIRYLETTEFLSLEEDKWVKALLYPSSENREIGYTIMSKTKYNITTEAGKLLSYYEDLLKKDNI